MDLSEEQLDKIVEKLAGKLKAQRHNRVVSNEEHNDHHIFITQFIKDQSLRRKFHRKIVESSVIWAIPVLITIVCVGLWASFKSAVMS